MTTLLAFEPGWRETMKTLTESELFKEGYVTSTISSGALLSEELMDLLRRMTVVETVVCSGDSVSWNAHREAEKLADGAVIEALQVFMKASSSKDTRRAVYFVLAALGNNLGNERCAQILLGQLGAVSDKYELAALLDSLAKVPIPPDAELEPVFGLFIDKRWLVRHAAIGALVNAPACVAEGPLLGHLASTEDPMDKIYCHAVLNRMGTARSIPLLTDGLKSRKRDVKASARMAIDAIEARLR